MEIVMLKKLKKWFSEKYPRYFYRLDDTIFDRKKKCFLYVFKLYGNHSFVKLYFKDIQISKKLRWLINPDDLIQIYLNEQQNNFNNSQYRIKEYKRNNFYVIANAEQKETLSGEDICSSPSLIEQINSFDIYKISFQTGFIQGRQLSKTILEDSVELYKSNTLKKDNIVKLHDL